MNYTKFEQNIIDVIKEEQIKLGYRRESIRLYYPLQSLNRLLGTSLDTEAMQHALEDYFNSGKSTLGKVEAYYKAERFCFIIPEDGVEYVHKNMPEKEFLRDFINAVGQHGCTIEQLLDVFHQYSDDVHFEKATHGEFDYLIFFENGKPDDFRYCITDEGCHMIYHRFTPDDYTDFEF